MKILRFIVFSFLLLVGGQTAYAQRQSILVAPQTTDPNITTNLNNHYVSVNRSVAQKNQLFLFFPGTGGVPVNCQQINNTAADLGFHAVNLTYPNDEPVNGLCGGTNTDLDCYGNVRLEIKDGVDRSNLVSVNRANSIENRLVKLLIHLRNTAPNQDWGQFLLDDNSINWSKIIVSGHSQGGGHAGIIGRFHSVARVVMFAAMDFNAATNSVANWIRLPNNTPNATAPDKFFGFSHQRDEMVNFTLLSNRVWTAYGMNNFGAITNVDAANPPYNNTHSLTSNADCANFHGCIVVDARLVFQNGIPVYKPVWEYLLSNTTAPLNLASIQFARNGQTVNRPAVGTTTKSYRIVVRGNGFDQQTRILVNGAETETEFVSVTELRAKLPAGKFGGIGLSTVQVRTQSSQISNLLAF
ncbi:MAG: IPT/TIG domain-containing protein [Acidobacteriota bacterium]|nr:IPT/TIG domain-containing protein [Acidobacteriota bacterium]